MDNSRSFAHPTAMMAEEAAMLIVWCLLPSVCYDTIRHL